MTDETLSESHECAINRIKKFLGKNIDNPKYNEKYVAFIKGKYQGVGDQQILLVLKMHEKFGDVPIHVYLKLLKTQ